MEIVERFEQFAEDFEAAVNDGNWQRLKTHLAEDATYENSGYPASKCTGRDAVVAYLKEDVTNTDLRFDSRTHTPLTSPQTSDNRLCRKWRCIYTLAGVPDLVVEGEARYLFEDGLIKAIEEEPTPFSILAIDDWMQKYDQRLRA